ncbi:hypothetical protein N7490_010913 [Penicillium lividum]|nr:hypothetical protein N7490_010913 [Penicillium lividum]
MKLSIFVPLATFLAFFAVAEKVEDSPSFCLNQCLNEAAAVANCGSQYNYDCTCPSVPFKNTVAICVKDACEPKDLEEVKKLHQERCGADEDA